MKNICQKKDDGENNGLYDDDTDKAAVGTATGGSAIRATKTVRAAINGKRG